MEPQSNTMSTQAKWNYEIAGALQGVGFVKLKKMPYKYFMKITNILHSHWQEYSPKIYAYYFLTSKYKTAFDLLKGFCVNGCRTSVIIKIAQEVNNVMLYQCLEPSSARTEKIRNRERERLNHDRDLTKGLFNELSEFSLILLGEILAEDPNWKQLADGLGIELLKTLDFLTPLDLLKEWKDKNRDATGSRLHYELQKLKVISEGRYLESKFWKNHPTYARDNLFKLLATRCSFSSAEYAQTVKCLSPGSMLKVNESAKKVIIENNAPKEFGTCTICYDRQITHLAFPCGHFSFCLECITKLNKCSFCNKDIEHKVKVFHNPL